MHEQHWQRITVDPKVMVGKPVIRGTRIPVELIVRMLAQGIPEADILREYPRLQPDDIRAALAYAAQVLADGGCLSPHHAGLGASALANQRIFQGSSPTASKAIR